MLSGQAVLGGQRALCGIFMRLPPQLIFDVFFGNFIIAQVHSFDKRKSTI
jgi:hypothetical protein